VATPGSYILISRLNEDTDISVGKLGRFTFAAGFYCYSGSARGPGGLEGRLARHLRQHKKPHWHVDYLLQRAAVVDIWTAPSLDRLECLSVPALLDLPGAAVPIPGFGSSDCSCTAHLVRVASQPSFRAFSAAFHVLNLHAPHWERIRVRLAER
jgi:Uri superfamily endonuclease